MVAIPSVGNMNFIQRADAAVCVGKQFRHGTRCLIYILVRQNEATHNHEIDECGNKQTETYGSYPEHSERFVMLTADNHEIVEQNQWAGADKGQAATDNCTEAHRHKQSAHRNTGLVTDTFRSGKKQGCGTDILHEAGNDWLRYRR